MKNMGEGQCPFGFGDSDPKQGSAGYTHSAMPTAMPRDKLPELVKEPIAEGEDGLRTGRCLCGEVSFKIKTKADKVFANHDADSRRWTGGVALTVMVRASNTAFHGWGRVVQHATNDRDRHCFCRVCGSSLFVRHVLPEAMDGMISISAGCLDSTEGLVLAADTYVDAKPGYYTFEGNRRGMTTAEIEAMQAPKTAAE